MKGLFPMRRAEAAVLLFLVAYSAFSFLPVWREIVVAGIAVFGWLMVALMLISPALTLLVFLGGERRE